MHPGDPSNQPDRPDRRGNRRGGPPARPGAKPFEIVGWDGAEDRADVLSRTTAWVLTTTLVAAVAMAMLSLAQTPIGWIVTALGAVVGLLASLATEQLRRHRSRHQLPVGNLPTHLAEPVARAAATADRLRQLAERSPDGPIAEHFERLATSAEGYVVALHQTATQVAAAGGERLVRDPQLEADMRRIVGGLTELAEAAERLRQVQRHHLETSPLAELTEETERLTAVIEAESQALGRSHERPADSPPIGGSPPVDGDPDPDGR